jgi:histidinol dehydrogenase
MRLATGISVAALMVASALLAQDKPATMSMKDACMKRCEEMAARHDKMIEQRKAMMDKRDAAWKDIEAQLDAARKARGSKKVEALEAALDKLVAFHQDMMKQMETMGGPGMRWHGKMGPGMMDGCCGHMGWRDCPVAKGQPDSEE